MKKRTLVISLLMMFSLVFFLSCGDDNGTSSSGGGEISITVGSGTTPQYSWTGGNVMSVSVTRTSNQSVIVWGIASPASDGIASPATHGTVPNGAVATSFQDTENTLTAGVKYRVSVARTNGQTGWKEFTP